MEDTPTIRDYKIGKMDCICDAILMLSKGNSIHRTHEMTGVGRVSLQKIRDTVKKIG